MIAYEFVTTSSGAVMAEQLAGAAQALELGFGRSGQPRVSAPAGMKLKLLSASGEAAPAFAQGMPPAMPSARAISELASLGSRPVPPP
jgi:hypothetical protein